MLTVLHVIAVSLTLLFVLFADEEAFRYLIGARKTLRASRARFLHDAVAFGLASTIITGGLLYARSANFYLTDPAFIIKMVAIAALILNSLFLDRFSSIATRLPFSSLSRSQKAALLASGAVSVLGWLTALVCGFLLLH